MVRVQARPNSRSTALDMAESSGLLRRAGDQLPRLMFPLGRSYHSRDSIVRRGKHEAKWQKTAESLQAGVTRLIQLMCQGLIINNDHNMRSLSVWLL